MSTSARHQNVRSGRWDDTDVEQSVVTKGQERHLIKESPTICKIENQINFNHNVCMDAKTNKNVSVSERESDGAAPLSPYERRVAVHSQ